MILQRESFIRTRECYKYGRSSSLWFHVIPGLNAFMKVAVYFYSHVFKLLIFEYT